MTIIRKTAALTLALSFALTALVPVSAIAQGGCDWYAKISLKQQSDNLTKKCGFKGPPWSTNLQAHKNFCSSVPPAVWKVVAKKRKEKLAACK